MIEDPVKLNMNWQVKIHCYAANHIPDKDFASGGGMVYVALTHGGTYKCEDPFHIVPPFLSMTEQNGKFQTEHQSPEGGVKQDKTYRC